MDLISRQTAIDALREYIVDDGMYDMDENVQGFNDGISCAISELSGIPSAEPEGYADQLRWERDTAIQQLKELGYGLGEKPRTDGDTVSRQAAIDIATQYCPDDDGSCSKADRDIRELLDDLENLPPAQPEQRWIPWNSGKFPEESGTYTVTAYDGATKRVTYAKYQKRLKRWELTGARAYWRVLAWMPLPDPWIGEES